MILQDKQDRKPPNYLLGTFVAPVYSFGKKFFSQVYGPKFQLDSRSLPSHNLDNSQQVFRNSVEVSSILQQDYQIVEDSKIHINDDGKHSTYVRHGFLHHSYSDIWTRNQCIQMKVDKVFRIDSQQNEKQNQDDDKPMIVFHLQVSIYLSSNIIINQQGNYKKLLNFYKCNSYWQESSLQQIFDFFMIENTIPSIIHVQRDADDYLSSYYEKFQQKQFNCQKYLTDVAKIIVNEKQKIDIITKFDPNNPLYTEDSLDYILFTDSVQSEDIIIYEEKLYLNPQYVKLLEGLLNKYKKEVQELSEKFNQQEKNTFIETCCINLITKQDLQPFEVVTYRLDSLQQTIQHFISQGEETIQYIDIKIKRPTYVSNLVKFFKNQLSSEQSAEWLINLNNEILNNTHGNEEFKQQELIDILNSTDYQYLIKYPTPDTMESQLKPHQQQALTWMLYREKRIDRLFTNEAKTDWNRIQLSPIWQELKLPKGKYIYQNIISGAITDEFQENQWTNGGILADEMGLGKTIMALALIHETKSDKGQTLIVTPKSVVQQWQTEIIKHSKLNSMRVLVYYDIKDRIDKINFKDYDIIITTYAILTQDYQYWMDKQIEKFTQVNNNQEIRINQQEINQQSVNQVQQDQINNRVNQGRIKQIVKRLQNINSYDSDSSDAAQNHKSKKGQQNQASQNSQEGEEFQDEKVKLKKTRRKDLNCLFEHTFIRVILDEAHNIKNESSLCSQASYTLNTTYRWCLTGTPFQNKYEEIFSLLKFLRVDTFGEKYWWNRYIDQNSNFNYHNKYNRPNLLQQVLKPIILRRNKGNNTMDQIGKIDEQIIWIDLSADERKLYDQLKLGTQSLYTIVFQEDEQKGKRNFVHIFQILNKLRQACCHITVALKGIDVVDNIHETVKRIDKFFNMQAKEIRGQVQSDNYREDQINKIRNKELTMCTICMEEDIQTFYVSICAHVNCESCFSEAIRLRGSCPQCRIKLTIKDLLICQPIQIDDIVSIKQADSSKLIKLVEETLKVRQQGEKVLVFSQWIEVIQIIQGMFEQKKIVYQTITGAMPVNRRTKIIEQYRNCPETTALILSIKASATGLNLTMANHVFIVDPWWNPALEEQAIGRAHRIGQTKQVFVKRFLCKDTIEEKINILHLKKKLFQNILDQKENKMLQQEDIKFLIQ